MVEPLIYCEFCHRLIRPKETEKPGYDLVNRKICCVECLRIRFPELATERAQQQRRLSAEASRPAPPPDTEAVTIEMPRSDAPLPVGDSTTLPGIPDIEPEYSPPSRRAAASVAIGLLFGAVLAGLALILFPARKTAETPMEQAPVTGPSARTIEPSADKTPSKQAEVPASPAAPSPSDRRAAAVKEVLLRPASEVDNIPGALARIREYLEAQPGGDMAEAAIAKANDLKAEQDARTRTLWRSSAERIRELAAEGRMREARALLDGLRESPGEGAWVLREGPSKILMIESDLASARRQRMDAIVDRAREMVHGGRFDEAEAALAGLRALDWPDADALCDEALRRVAAWRARGARVEAAAAGAADRKRILSAFYKDLDARLMERDGEDLAEAIRKLDAARAGIADEDLEGFREDVRLVQAMYAALIKTLDGKKGQDLTVPLSKGSVRGKVESCDEKTLTLSQGQARFPVQIDRLTMSGARDLLGSPQHARALYVLGIARGETPENQDELNRAAKEAGHVTWPHLLSRLKFRAEQAAVDGLARRLDDLEAMERKGELDRLAGNVETLEKELRALGPEAVPENQRQRFANLRARLKKVERRNLTLQNGVSPKDYAGISLDQISAQREDVEITDRAVQWGVKIGSFDDLKRILIKFDGIEKAIGGKARVRKATLELYQTEAAAAEGAVGALFRLRREWVPDGGTWMCYDQKGRKRWQSPGASGSNDIHGKPDATLTFDGRKDLWRGWDVTAYVQEILDGKAPNNGLLLRVLTEEPKYHIRFYPEKDLDAKPDPKCRPRLLIEIEQVQE